MGTHVIGLLQRTELADQFHAAGGMRIVAFVISDIVPGVFQLACPFGSVNQHFDLLSHVYSLPVSGFF